MAGISGKDWIRLQQRRGLGDEGHLCRMEMIVSASSTTVVRRGNMASRPAQVSEQGMQWAAHARHVGYFTALHCTTLYCTVLLR